jgi:hypothetical protein
MKKILYLCIVVLAATACEKELSLEGGYPKVDPLPQIPIDTAPVFQLTAFYSDIPIDFNESDSVVKSETDLWAYVLDYIKDDYHVFRNDSTVEVLQNNIKWSGDTSSMLVRQYQLGQDNLGDYMIYLSPEYEQTKYRLSEWSEDYFVISVKWKYGASLYSRFDRVR